jgi:hypothetical protein
MKTELIVSCLMALYKFQRLLSVELCERIKAIGELERIWKETVVIGFILFLVGWD